jgi:hypothetical protein
MTKRLGKMMISHDLLLQFFDFVGGEIRDIRYGYGYSEFLIAHEDMPIVNDGDVVPIVTPTYLTSQDGLGNKVTYRDRSEKL